MKHTVAFVLVLALVLFTGYYSVNIYEFFSGSSRPETRLRRNVQDYGSAYISGEETGFNPMELIENAGSSASNYSEQNYFDTSSSNFIKDICAALLSVISHYDIRAQITPDMGKKLASGLKIENGYIYTEKFAYTNVRNETRYLDCILTSGDLRIVYLRFYSDEEIQVSAEETDEALKEFDSMSRQFYYSVENEVNTAYNYVESRGICLDKQFDISDRYHAYDACYESYLSTYSIIKECISNDNQLCLFWIIPAFLMPTVFNNNENLFSAVSVAHICERMIYSSDISDMEYTAYQGRIYQNVFFDNRRLITIYNIRDRCIEGFYAPTSNN